MAERRDVTRSKDLIRRGYFELRMEKNQSKITVRDIIERANVSRGTFYAHFKDIAALERDLEYQIAEKCNEALSRTDLRGVVESPAEYIEQLLVVMEENRNILKAFITSEGHSNLAFQVKDLVYRSLVHVIKDDPHREELLLAGTMVSSAVIDACLEFIDGSYDMSRKEFIETTSRFIRDGVKIER